MNEFANRAGREPLAVVSLYHPNIGPRGVAFITPEPAANTRPHLDDAPQWVLEGSEALMLEAIND